MKLDTAALDRVLRAWVLEFFPHAQDELLQWPGVEQVFRIVSETTRSGRKTHEVRDFITSLTRGEANARRLLEIVRRHWSAIENGLHWKRDVVFRAFPLNHLDRERAAKPSGAAECRPRMCPR